MQTFNKLFDKYMGFILNPFLSALEWMGKNWRLMFALNLLVIIYGLTTLL